MILTRLYRALFPFSARDAGVPGLTQPHSDIAIARRVESARAQKASADRQRARRRAALEKAATLGHVTVPMRPRSEIAAEVQAIRARRKLLGDID